MTDAPVIMPERNYQMMMDTLKQQNEVLQVAVKELTAMKNNPSSTTPNAGVMHGVNPNGTYGLFTGFGVNPRMFSTIVRARGEFDKLVTARPTRFLNVRREIVSGITAASGTSAANFCATAPTAGDPKVCRFDAEFGSVMLQSKTVNVMEIGSRYNIADQDREVLGLQDFGKFIPDVVGAMNPNSQTWRTFYTMGIEIERELGKVDFQGVQGVAGGTTYPAFISQFGGLDTLIKTGYTDVVSGQACPALDSRVITFGSDISTTSTNGYGTIVDAITDMLTGIMIDMEFMGYKFDLSQLAVAVNKRMWRPLTRVWPCAYVTTGCSTIVDANGQRLVLDATSQREMQDSMYNGRYLLIDGMQIPVILVDGDVQTVNLATGKYTSSIYVLPLVLNGERTLYYEYFDVNNAELTDFISAGGAADADLRVINNGMYLLSREKLRACMEYTVMMKLRLMLDAPFAAGRIDAVTYSDNTRMRDAYPGTSYHFNGGITNRTTVG